MLVKKLRLQRGWSQEQLAELSGLNVRTIQRFERGQSPGLESMKALAAVFEIQVEHFKQEPSMDKPQSNSEPSSLINYQEKEALDYVKGVKDFYTHLVVFILVNLGLVALNLFLTPSYYWFIYALLGWGVGVVLHALTVFDVFNLFGPDWERRQVEKRLGRKL